jgi:hypothetical protein
VFAGYSWSVADKSGESTTTNVSGEPDLKALAQRLVGKTIESMRGTGQPPQLVVEFSEGCVLSTSSDVGEGPDWSVSFRALGLGHLAVGADGRLQHDLRTS